MIESQGSVPEEYAGCQCTDVIGPSPFGEVPYNLTRGTIAMLPLRIVSRSLPTSNSGNSTNRMKQHSDISRLHKKNAAKECTTRIEDAHQGGVHTPRA